MKYTKPFVAASLAALLAAGAAQAQSNAQNQSPDRNDGVVAVDSGVKASDSDITKGVKRTLNKADNAMRRTADDIHALFVDTDKNALNPVTFSFDATTEGMIGEDVLNPQGKSIAKAEDLLITKDGMVSKVVVADGGLLGIGEKLAAFDYGRVITQDKDGEVVMNLSQADIDGARKFSYDREDSATSDILPSGAISAKALADGDVYDTAGKKVGTVENVTIADGKAANMIVRFDQTLGMGGDLAALDYGSLNVVKADGDVKVMLTERQSEQFRDFRKMTRTN